MPRSTQPTPIVPDTSGSLASGSLASDNFASDNLASDNAVTTSSLRPSAPASNRGTAGGPKWPDAPPSRSTTATGISPTVEPERAGRSRTKSILAALAGLLLIGSVAFLGFFLGNRLATRENATAPVVAPTAVEAEAPAAAATEAPAAPTTAPAPPTAVPAAPAPAPILPADGAVEPVAAVAQAVAPAVVLVTNDLGQGSGIIYDAQGLILTNAHVVGSFTEVTITLASGVRVPGQVLGADPLTDVAVIQIDTDVEFGVATLAPDSSVQVGQLAVAIGSPFGLEQTVTSGVVSARGRVLINPIETGGESIVAMIQTDAPINPGNSGGALADRQGRVIGMNTSIRTDGSGAIGNVGVGFAIPSDTARLIADRIVAGEPLERGFLGVGGDTPLIGEPGVVVTEVTPGSGAEAAGVQVGDLIVGFNGIEIKGLPDLAAAVRLEGPEAVAIVEFVRDGSVQTVEVILGLPS